jgi:hypothetical protein
VFLQAPDQQICAQISQKSIKNVFLFCTYNTVSIKLKRGSKGSSFRYAFAVTHSELLLGDHCVSLSRHFKFKSYNCSSIYQRYQSLYLSNIIFLALCFELFLNLRGKIEKNIVLYSFYKPLCRTCLLYSTRRCAPRALKNACEKMVSYETRIIKNYFRICVYNTSINVSQWKSFMAL